MVNLRCPVCAGALEKRAGAYLCPKNHSFDIAKSGYVNLLLNSSQGHHGDDKLMVRARRDFLDKGYYDRFIAGTDVEVVYNQTYPLLASATAALVTSGTATLETALFGVPQVVCYETPIPQVIAFLRRHLLKVRYISLVNLIADREVVRELVADTFSVENIRRELLRLLPGQPAREEMLRGYDEVRRRLGDEKAPDNAARIMISKLSLDKGAE